MTRPDPKPTVSRRRFMWQASCVCTVAVSAARPAVASMSEVRSIDLLHTHTGERLSTDYWKAGQYVPESLDRVNHLLRDFRTNDLHVIDPTLLDILYQLQLMADRSGPFQVISGYRSPATNEMLRSRSDGVAQHSMHLVGRAIDIRLPGFSTRRLGEHARTLARGGVGFYAASDFVHVDTGRVRFW